MPCSNCGGRDDHSPGSCTVCGAATCLTCMPCLDVTVQKLFDQNPTVKDVVAEVGRTVSSRYVCTKTECRDRHATTACLSIGRPEYEWSRRAAEESQ